MYTCARAAFPHQSFSRTWQYVTACGHEPTVLDFSSVKAALPDPVVLKGVVKIGEQRYGDNDDDDDDDDDDDAVRLLLVVSGGSGGGGGGVGGRGEVVF